MNTAVRALADEGAPIKQIVLRTGCSRQTVRRILRGEREDVFRARMSSIEPWLFQLDEAWSTGSATAPSSGVVSASPASAAAFAS